jgi:hypothetical protein
VPDSQNELIAPLRRSGEDHANSAATERNRRDAVASQFDAVDSAFRIMDVVPVGGLVRGALNESETAFHRGTFEPGTDYLIVGRCDADCADVDLQLSTLDGAVIAEDRAADDKPYVSFRAQAGSYRVRVTMTACQQEPCAYGLRLYKASDAPSSR